MIGPWRKEHETAGLLKRMEKKVVRKEDADLGDDKINNEGQLLYEEKELTKDFLEMRSKLEMQKST